MSETSESGLRCAALDYYLQQASISARQPQASPLAVTVVQCVPPAAAIRRQRRTTTARGQENGSLGSRAMYVCCSCSHEQLLPPSLYKRFRCRFSQPLVSQTLKGFPVQAAPAMNPDCAQAVGSGNELTKSSAQFVGSNEVLELWQWAQGWKRK